jgi:AraC family transcriptional regulator
MDVELVVRDEQRVAFVRHIGPYDEVGAAWEKLMGFAVSRNLMKNAFFGLSYDDPDITDANKLRYDACVVVDADIDPSGEIGIQTVAGGTYAKFRHVGPYQQFSTTYAAFFEQWLPDSGYEVTMIPCVEQYLNDPRSTPEHALETDVYVSLTRK